MAGRWPRGRWWPGRWPGRRSQRLIKRHRGCFVCPRGRVIKAPIGGRCASASEDAEAQAALAQTQASARRRRSTAHHKLHRCHLGRGALISIAAAVLSPSTSLRAAHEESTHAALLRFAAAILKRVPPGRALNIINAVVHIPLVAAIVGSIFAVNVLLCRFLLAPAVLLDGLIQTIRALVAREVARLPIANATRSWSRAATPALETSSPATSSLAATPCLPHASIPLPCRACRRLVLICSKWT